MLFWDGELAGFMAMKNEVECNNDDNNEEKHVVIQEIERSLVIL